MAEPRKVQFVTLSAFAAGAAADSRKRRLEDGADFNFGRGGAVEAATGAGGAAAAAAAGGDRLGQAGDRTAAAVAATTAAAAEKRATVRLNLSLSEPDDRSSVEFNYGELIQNIQVGAQLGGRMQEAGECGVIVGRLCGLVIGEVNGVLCVIHLVLLVERAAWLKLTDH